MAECAALGSYTEPGGIDQLKKATAGFYCRNFNLNVEAERILIGPGTKSLFYMIFSMLDCEYIIPSPSWIGYTPQLDLLGRKWYTIKLLPEECPDELRDGLEKIAATIYTNVTTPVQYAATKVYAESSEIDEYLYITRSIHEIIGQKLSERFARIPGLKATRPMGGFYFLTDFNNYKEAMIKKGVSSANELSKALINHPHSGHSTLFLHQN